MDDNKILATGNWIPYECTIFKYYKKYPENETGIYFLFVGIEYGGEEHIGIFHTLQDTFTRFDEMQNDPKHSHYDWAIIYTMGETALNPYLRWGGRRKGNVVTVGWRKVK